MKLLNTLEFLWRKSGISLYPSHRKIKDNFVSHFHCMQDCNNLLLYNLNHFFNLDREAIESLESEGLVYSTIDECHFKSTSA